MGDFALTINSEVTEYLNGFLIYILELCRLDFIYFDIFFLQKSFQYYEHKVAKNQLSLFSKDKMFDQVENRRK